MEDELEQILHEAKFEFWKLGFAAGWFDALQYVRTNAERFGTMEQSLERADASAKLIYDRQEQDDLLKRSAKSVVEALKAGSPSTSKPKGTAESKAKKPVAKRETQHRK